MATFNIASGDEVLRDWVGGFSGGNGEHFYATGDNWVGQWDVDLYGFETWWVAEGAFRFTNVTIPKGSVVSAASIHIKTTTSGVTRDTTNLDIQACDEDNSAQITTFSDFGSRARTTADVAWAQNFADTTEYTSPDITTVIQEIIDRAGWASGNALQIIISDHTYKYPNHPPGTGDYAGYANILDDATFDITLSVTYVFTSDIGFRVRTGAGTVNIGTQTLLSTHKLRIRKGATTYGIPLLATTDPDASGVRIYDGTNVKALPKVS